MSSMSLVTLIPVSLISDKVIQHVLQSVTFCSGLDMMINIHIWVFSWATENDQCSYTSLFIMNIKQVNTYAVFTVQQRYSD